MTALLRRVESGAREERARIANMGFFERRRYLNIPTLPKSTASIEEGMPHAFVEGFGTVSA